GSESGCRQQINDRKTYNGETQIARFKQQDLEHHSLKYQDFISRLPNRKISNSKISNSKIFKHSMNRTTTIPLLIVSILFLLAGCTAQRSPASGTASSAAPTTSEPSEWRPRGQMFF